MSHYNWVLAPQAKVKLKASGLLRRIEEANGDKKFQSMGHVADYEVKIHVERMKRSESFVAAPISDRTLFEEKADYLIKSGENVSWKIKRKNMEVEEPVDPYDLMLLCGVRSSELFSWQEIFSYKSQGFSSVFDFTGTTGAAIEFVLKKNSIVRDGIEWETPRSNQTIIHSKITGDAVGNNDLTIYQTDITAYETVDPLGNKVLYRPVTSFDSKGITTAHFTESTFLFAILKYVEQLGLKPACLENDAKTIIELVKSLGEERKIQPHRLSEFKREAKNLFISNVYPLPQLDSKGETKDRFLYALPKNFEGYFFMAVGPEGEFLIGNQNNAKNSMNLNSTISFLPQEIDDVIKGLFYLPSKI
jgi:hypothetical protein